MAITEWGRDKDWQDLELSKKKKYCKIKGCGWVVYEADLCEKHYKLERYIEK